MASTYNPNDEEPLPEHSLEEMNVPEVRESLQRKLNRLELQMFEDWRIDFARWTYDRGYNPSQRQGYAYNSMRDIINRVERFCEWLYIGDEIRKKNEDDDFDLDEFIASNNGEEFTVEFTAEHLDRYWYHIKAVDNLLDTSRRSINSVELVLKYQGIDWEIPESDEVYEQIKREESDPGFRDYYRGYELSEIKLASLRLESVPDRDTLTEDELDEWAVRLAQRLGKPKYALEDDDWEADSWKIPSLVFLSCDIGLRPCEIHASRIQWVDTKKEGDAYIRIPREEDSKAGKRHRECKVSPETARILNYWLEERAENPKYEDSDAIWLTRKGNPYQSGSLRDLMIRLQREAGMGVAYRENGWYMIRRGVGTDIINKGGDITTLMRLLRINRVETAQRYVNNAHGASDRYYANR
jgi:integrase